MKLLNRFVFLVGLGSSAFIASSQTTFYCPNTQQLIQVGQSMEQVKQLCGEPKSEVAEEIESSEMVKLEQWGYIQRKEREFYSPEVTEVLLSFYEGIVLTIEVNGEEVDGGAQCEQGVVEVGSFASQVQYNCGSPNFKQKIQKRVVTDMQGIVKWNYGFTRPLELVFEKGRLARINQ